MKKAIRIIAIIALASILACSISVFASENKSEASDVPHSKLSADDISTLQNKDLYDKSMGNFEYIDQPVLKIFFGIYYNLLDKPLDTLIQAGDGDTTVDYFILGDDNCRITKYNSGNIALVKKPFETMYLPDASNELPIFLSDIINCDREASILGNSCKIEDVYCFCEFHSHFGACVYYNTDKGIFIKYYDDARSKGLWYTERDFAKLGKEYYAMLTSPGHNYDSEGNELYGGNIGFTEFIKNKKSEENKPKNVAAIAAVCAVAVIACVLAAAVITAFVIRSKRRNKAK